MCCCSETQKAALSAVSVTKDCSLASFPLVRSAYHNNATEFQNVVGKTQRADDSSAMALRSLRATEQSTPMLPLHAPLHSTLQCAGVVASIDFLSLCAVLRLQQVHRAEPGRAPTEQACT